MVKTEVLKNGLIHTYSDDATKRLQKVGTDEVYDDALDVIGTSYVYIEVDKPIEAEPVVEVDNEENDFIEIDKPVVENDEEEITTLRRQGWNKE